MSFYKRNSLSRNLISFFIWFLVVLGILSLVLVLSKDPSGLVEFDIRYFEKTIPPEISDPNDTTFVIKPLSTLEKVKLTNEYRRSMIQLFGGIFVAIGLIFTAMSSRAARKNAKTAQQGQINDRLIKAVNQLENLDSPVTMISGLYSLKKISQDYSIDSGIVLDIFISFIQNFNFSFARAYGNSPEEVVKALFFISGFNNKLKDQRALVFPDLFLPNGNLSNLNLPKVGFGHSDFTQADLSNSNFTYANFNNTILKDASLIGADFSYALLIGTNFTSADLQNVCFKGARLKSNTLGTAVNLNSCDFSNAIIEGGSFREKKLSDLKAPFLECISVNFESTILNKANFKKAILKGVDFRSALLIEANLYNANLENADLRGANLEKANLRRANLEGAQLERYINIQKIIKANLDIDSSARKELIDKAIKEERNYLCTNLTKAILRDAILVNCNFSFANLSNADMTKADLTNANLQYAIFNGTILKNANLEGADFRNTGIKYDQIIQAKNYNSAIFDESISKRLKSIK